MIFASTNADRIGTFHAIGHKAAQTEQTIEVFQMMISRNTKGINMPLYYHGSFLAVIGIPENRTRSASTSILPTGLPIC